MSDQQREICHSENGDRWLVCREHDGRVFVLHKANVSSGGTATKIELGDFLGKAVHVGTIAIRTGSPQDENPSQAARRCSGERGRKRLSGPR